MTTPLSQPSRSLSSSVNTIAQIKLFLFHEQNLYLVLHILDPRGVLLTSHWLRCLPRLRLCTYRRHRHCYKVCRGFEAPARHGPFAGQSEQKPHCAVSLRRSVGQSRPPRMDEMRSSDVTCFLPVPFLALCSCMVNQAGLFLPRFHPNMCLCRCLWRGCSGRTG